MVNFTLNPVSNSLSNTYPLNDVQFSIVSGPNSSEIVEISIFITFEIISYSFFDIILSLY